MRALVDCSGGGGGGGGGGVEKPKVVPTEVQWGGLIFEPGLPSAESVFRPCVANTVKPSGSNGSYDCELNPDRTINYMLGVGVQTLLNGDPDFCEVFKGIVLAPNHNYHYRWSGKCFESECTILIQNSFHEMENVPETLGAHGIVLRAFAGLGVNSQQVVQ